MPVAQQGVIDISEWDMVRSGPVRLDGEWKLYWNRLLSPQDFLTNGVQDKPGLYPLPGSWNEVLSGGKPLGGLGYATLRLRIIPGGQRTRAALRLFNICSAYILWADGRIVSHSGKIATSDGREREHTSLQIVSLPLKGEPIDLTLQISNFHYREGGVLSPILLGPENAVLAQRSKTSGMALITIGVFLAMALYHVVLNFFRRKNVSPWLFALYCLAWMCFYATSDYSEWAILLFFPDLSSRFMEHFALGCFFLSLPIGLAFFRSLYPQEFSLRVLLASVCMAGFFTVLAIWSSTLTLTTILPFSFMLAAVFILYTAARLIKAWRLGREGAPFIFLSFIPLGVAGINDMLLDMKYVSTGPFLAPGLLAFILCQALALSKRFSNAFNAVETLSKHLEDKNLRLEMENAERLRLEKEVLDISEAERRRMSQDLHDGLCQNLAGARLRLAALATAPDSGQDATPPLEQLSTMMDQLVDQAYALSCGLWPLEHITKQTGPSLADLTRRFSKSSGIPVEFHQYLACSTCLNPNVTQMHRIAQEALSNAVKHANPSRIVVFFSCAQGAMATLKVSDDGVGRANATASKGGLGMSIMIHRTRQIGGELRIEDGPDGGTVVTCTMICEIHGRRNRQGMTE